MTFSEDPIVRTLRNLFGANIVRVPEERIQPSIVVAGLNGKAWFRGDLPPMIKGKPAVRIRPIDIDTSTMADISGRRSRQADLELGLDILGGFLQGFGVPAAGIYQKFAKATKVSFAFQDVVRRYIDINWLGRILSGRTVDRDYAPAAMFFEDSYEFLVIDSVIGSSAFTINVERHSEQDFKLDVPAIQSIVGQANVGVSVASASGLDLTFRGSKRLTFAYSCVRFYLDADGSISAIKPALRNYLLNAPEEVSGWITEPTNLPSPDRVLLGEEPRMISWEDEPISDLRG